MKRSSKSGALDVLVIGAGQAGLVMGYHLIKSGHRFRIVDAGAEVGQTWKLRWESLKLFTAAQYDNLPGMEFPAPRDTYPGKDDVARFLKAYAAKFELPVSLNTKVTSLRRNGRYTVETNQGPLEAASVVVATGPFQSPFTPRLAEELDANVFQMHGIDYRRPEDIPSGRVLVVGTANSGCQIALELSATHEVEISAGRHLPAIPQRPLARDVWWWLTLLQLTRVTSGSRVGKRMATKEQVIGGGEKELVRHGVVVRPRLSGVKGRSLAFADGTSSEYDAVLWATGYRVDHSWIQIPEIKDEHGLVEHQRGITAAPGLYLLGLSWQHTRTSALLGWVTKDAEFLVDHIASRPRSLV